MEISEDQPNAKAIYSELGMERVSHPSLTFWQRETQRQAEGWERLIVERKGGFMCALTGGCWPGEAVGRLIRSGASFVVS